LTATINPMPPKILISTVAAQRRSSIIKNSGRTSIPIRLRDWFCKQWKVSSATPPLPSRKGLRAKVLRLFLSLFVLVLSAWCPYTSCLWDKVLFPKHTAAGPLLSGNLLRQKTARRVPATEVSPSPLVNAEGETSVAGNRGIRYDH